jgi:hypothetical protein
VVDRNARWRWTVPPQPHVLGIERSVSSLRGHNEAVDWPALLAFSYTGVSL